MVVDLKATELYSNREVSWLAFNQRVLAMAARPDVPLLERLKFVAIAASNLDEFFMVRVGSLERQKQRQDEHRFEPGPDGLDIHQVFTQIRGKANEIRAGIATVLCDDVLPLLADHGVQLLTERDLDPDLTANLRKYYRSEVHPCLTPIAVDGIHPFPSLRSGSLNLAVTVVPAPDSNNSPIARPDRPDGPLMAVVQLPALLPRFVRFDRSASTIADRSASSAEQPGAEHHFMALEQIIALFVEELFVGHNVVETAPFRVIRASDLDLDEYDADDLLTTIEDQLRQRDRGEPVRLVIDERASASVQERLRKAIGVTPEQTQAVRGLLDPSALFSVLGQVELPALENEPHQSAQNPRLRYGPTIFRSIREQDVLLHHPYETFRHVVDFLEQAAADPDVVAIKQTLYRTSGDSPIIRALQRAAEAGKEVTALIELKARFDEANNISWAKQLEESGAHVVYGLIGFKTHSKMLLVTRREGGQLTRYAHLSTGNYNPKTAGLYTDLGLLTANEDLTHDAMLLFNVLTGYAELPQMRRLVVAPFTMRAHTLDYIEREIEFSKAGAPAAIRAKMNSLVDGPVIEALYRASQAGVKVELMVRGICCLRPGIPGVSENIEVRSIVDRFLEHSRLFWWQNGGEDEIFLSSADWMPRNLNKRIEVGFPILDVNLKRRIMEDIWPTEWADNIFSWNLRADGTYVARTPDEEAPRRAQTAFIRSAREKNHPSTPNLRPEVAKPHRMSPAARAAHAQLRRLG